MRSPQDYQKVRGFISWLLRNRGFQSARARLQPLEYLHAGCGPQIAAGFINLDYRWVPGVDVVWDLTRPLPFPAGRFQGIFTEHCLEHFDETDLPAILRELHRVLKPGGRIRIVVPSVEIHARRYLTAHDQSAGSAEPAQIINRVFYSGHNWMKRSHWNNDGHHFMHDAASLGACLQAVGFAEIRPATFGQGGDPHLLIDRHDREWESLYLEATKPAIVGPAS